MRDNIMGRTLIISRHVAAISFARSELERAGLLVGEPEVLSHLDDETLSQLGEGFIVQVGEHLWLSH